jgi:hypothetical protein
MYDKVFAIFGTMMVFFYLGLAIFLLTTKLIPIDKALRIVLAVPLIVYAIYRVLVSYEKIKESFFSNDDEDE